MFAGSQRASWLKWRSARPSASCLLTVGAWALLAWCASLARDCCSHDAAVAIHEGILQRVRGLLREEPLDFLCHESD